MPQRVLIVDDDRDLSAVLACRCAGLGLEVLTAHDTPEALSIIETAMAWASTQQERSGRRRSGLACRLEALVPGRFTHPPNRRLAKHVLGHAINWFWFLIDPTIDATNWRAEQAIRPAVVNRKVWGGNRTWRGATGQAVLTSLLVTLEQRGCQSLEWFSAARCARQALPLPP